MQEELRKEVDLVLYENQNIIVENKKDYSNAGDVLKLVKNKIKFLEDKRKEYTSDLVRQKKRIDDDFKEMQKPLKELVEKVNSTMVAWNVAEQRRLDEEQKKIEDEAREKLREEDEERKKREEKTGAKEEIKDEIEVPIVNEGLKSNRGDIATSTMTQTYSFEVEDLEKVPREYLIVNIVKVGKEVRESKGKVEIAGIKNVITNKISSR